jgi:pyruvate dehydrogenase E1 component beta subunit
MPVITYNAKLQAWLQGEKETATMPILSYREALRHAMDEELARDPNVVIMGEEVAQFNGAYKVTEGLLEKYGPKRIVDTPISEAGFIGLGIGASMLGIRPVMELMFWSFSYVAFDQIFNNAASVRYMSGGLINVPIVIRGPANGGTNVGATHSHTPENFIANTPGLKVVCPATPYDAKGLMKAAIRDNDPVYVMENTILYNDRGEVPAEDYVIPLGKADVKRVGKDLTIIAHGRAVMTSLKAAEILQAEHDVSVEVVDLRTIRPLDVETILASVRKTHRALLVEENKPFCGVGAQISHLIQSEAFDDLDAPVKRVSALDAPEIYSMPLEKMQLPDAQRVVRAALNVG